MSALNDLVPAGVIVGDDVQKVFAYAKAHQFALPAANCTGTNTVNGCLEIASELNAPMIIQFSNGGAAFYAGKALSNTGQRAAIAGAIAGAQHVHQLAEAYGARVHGAHRSLRQEASALGRRPVGRRRGLLQGARQAALQLAHARPVGGAAVGESSRSASATSSA